MTSMINIEQVQALHLTLGPQGASILTAALFAALQGAAQTGAPAGVPAAQPDAAKAPDEAAPTAPVQTSAPPALGEIWPGQGGRYGGTMPPRNGRPGYHLVVAEAQHAGVAYGPYGHDVPAAADHHDGLANSLALQADNADHPAAQWALQVQADGHSDFYLPAHAEICQLWINVPELFTKDGWYWSSTQYSPNGAWVQDFEYGYSNGLIKGGERRAVAVRRLVI
ncbi:MAG: hypothetical protein AB7I35_01495 [Ramlibacter sp.]